MLALEVLVWSKYLGRVTKAKTYYGTLSSSRRLLRPIAAVADPAAAYPCGLVRRWINIDADQYTRFAEDCSTPHFVVNFSQDE